jgi:hypothetical protein
MIIVEGAVPLIDTAKYKLVRMGRMYYALLKEFLEDGTEIINIKPLSQISELATVPIRNDE